MKVEIIQFENNSDKFAIGDVVLICGEPYIIGMAGLDEIVLINLSTGNRWCEPTEFDDMYNISKLDLDFFIEEEWCAAEAEVKVFAKR